MLRICLFLLAGATLINVAACDDPAMQSQSRSGQIAANCSDPGAKKCDAKSAKSAGKVDLLAKNIELGAITWGRDFDKAAVESKKSGKPIMILFDEVPGCGTCQNFGKFALSNPLVKDAAMECFIPVFVNNRTGNHATAKDRATMKRFKEPSWNNPVVRFVDSAGKDIIPRVQKYDSKTLLVRMAKALEKAKKPLPEYLRLAKLEYAPAKPKTAIFAMGCFWSGERGLGKFKGVIAVNFGFIKGTGGADEVVKVDYDSSITTLKELVSDARKYRCARRFVARTEDQAKIARKIFGKDVIVTKGKMRYEKPQYSLYAARPAIYLLPITQLQAVKLNSYYKDEKQIGKILSPTQKQLRGRLQKILKGKSKKQLAAIYKKLAPDNYRRLGKGTIDSYRQILLKFIAENSARSAPAKSATSVKK